MKNTNQNIEMEMQLSNNVSNSDLDLLSSLKAEDIRMCAMEYTKMFTSKDTDPYTFMLNYSRVLNEMQSISYGAKSVNESRSMGPI